MFVFECLGELMHTGFEGLHLQLLPLGHQLIQHPFRLPHEAGCDAQLAQARPGEIIFVIAKQFLKYSQ